MTAALEGHGQGKREGLERRKPVRDVMEKAAWSDRPRIKVMKNKRGKRVGSSAKAETARVGVVLKR